MAALSSNDIVMGIVCAIAGSVISSFRSSSVQPTAAQQQSHVKQSEVHQLSDSITVVCNVSCSCDSSGPADSGFRIFGMFILLGITLGVCISLLFFRYCFRRFFGVAEDQTASSTTASKGSSKTGPHRSALALQQ